MRDETEHIVARNITKRGTERNKHVARNVPNTWHETLQIMWHETEHNMGRNGIKCGAKCKTYKNRNIECGTGLLYMLCCTCLACLLVFASLPARACVPACRLALLPACLIVCLPPCLLACCTLPTRLPACPLFVAKRNKHPFLYFYGVSIMSGRRCHHGSQEERGHSLGGQGMVRARQWSCLLYTSPSPRD